VTVRGTRFNTDSDFDHNGTAARGHVALYTQAPDPWSAEWHALPPWIGGLGLVTQVLAIGFSWITWHPAAVMVNSRQSPKEKVILDIGVQ
jgi:hypothetical protein